MSIIIRLANPSDAEVIHAITQDAWEEYRGVPGSSSAFSETAEGIRSLLESDRIKAAVGFLDDIPVAAVRFTVTDHLYFSRLAVRRMYQGRGYARTLLRWIEEFAKECGVDEVRCMVRASVRRNVYLYESTGYCKVDERVIQKSPDVRLTVWTMVKRLCAAAEPTQTLLPVER
jgi:ribosomal protein S18 acetylase RimI-like enzyme